MTKMKKGEIEMELYYLDEITGEKKTGRYKPLHGLSLTGTFVGEMPLLQTPKATSTKSYYYSTSNRNGLPILVKDLGKKQYKDDYLTRVIQKKDISDNYLRGNLMYGALLRMMSIFGSLTREDFYNRDGMVKVPENPEIINTMNQQFDEDRAVFGKMLLDHPYITLNK